MPQPHPAAANVAGMDIGEAMYSTVFSARPHGDATDSWTVPTAGSHCSVRELLSPFVSASESAVTESKSRCESGPSFTAPRMGDTGGVVRGIERCGPRKNSECRNS